MSAPQCFSAIDAFSPAYMQSFSADLFSLISPTYSMDETECLTSLLAFLNVTADEEQAIAQRATSLIESVRQNDRGLHKIDALLAEYSLDTDEGVLLMCLAEALMRVPDKATVDALIRDKLSMADWKKHARQSPAFWVNASTWGLMLTGKVVASTTQPTGVVNTLIDRLVTKLSEPVIRTAMNQAMAVMARHFVLGDNMTTALQHAKSAVQQGYRYSFDRLGEAALTIQDAQEYIQAYHATIDALGEQALLPKMDASISIKLSALHPRYEAMQAQRVLSELFDTVLALLKAARAADIAVTIDAEEADRLELSLQLFEKLYRDDAVKGWGQFGLVVQAYAKRALPVLSWLAALSREQGDVIPVRLVKGAYWDSEIKHSQQLGLAGYPVFTRKAGTDVSYLACAKFLLNDTVRQGLAAQFATHNAHTLAAILLMAGDYRGFEFQRLHGMGESLYQQVMADEKVGARIYAPVGDYQDLLPYLVRRLLENGANSSFVHRLVDANTPIADLVHHPAERLRACADYCNPRIPVPHDLFLPERVNAKGWNNAIEAQWVPLDKAIRAYDPQHWVSGSIIDGADGYRGEPRSVCSPYDHRVVVGQVYWASEGAVEQAIASAHAAFDAWSAEAVEVRARCLEKLSDLLEANTAEWMALCQREAGKTLQDALDEIREAVDFCRYYAVQARRLFTAQSLAGPTGESNILESVGRGVLVCISPWNFPLAIFIGQVVAALVTGNTVIAKPAEATSLIAAKTAGLIVEAGVPAHAIQLVLGDGAVVGAQLAADPRIAGVLFTGSTATAQRINHTLAERDSAIGLLIAETGGQNAMIVDSTALPEQVVQDVIDSAFGSAGQRCSALRVLYIQTDIADRVISLIKGAMAELMVGDPRCRATDIGPVIDKRAQASLQQHIDDLKQTATLIAQTELPAACQHGTFIAPTAFEIPCISVLDKEQFGPILHIVRYAADRLDHVIDDINATGFGLTLGIHSRNATTANAIAERVKVGNVYINRNQIGAVVGVQPFGGRGLSGTGPKAGGPNYLHRLVTEKTYTINTASIGGNASLLALTEDENDKGA